MKINRIARISILVLAISFFALSLNACDFGNTGQSPNNKGQATKQNDGRFNGATLNLLTWEGYADPLFTAEFEYEYGCTVVGTYFSTSDDLLTTLQQASPGEYDVISPSGDMAGYLVKEDMVEPIDTSLLTHLNEIDSSFFLEDVTKDDQIYGIPYLWGPDYLIYNADIVKETPTSWDVFWDPQYSGKISLYNDISNIYMVGQMEGLDAKDPLAIYNMSDAQLEDAKKKLQDLNSSVKAYWETANELDDLFTNGDVALAVGWPITIADLKGKGYNVNWVIPDEGCTGWMDRLMIVKGSKNKELATLYIDFMTSAKGQALSSLATYYSVVNHEAGDFMSPEQKELTYVDEFNTFFGKINFWQYVKDRDKYNDAWAQVVG